MVRIIWKKKTDSGVSKCRYEIARFSFIQEDGLDCVTANYSTKPNGHVKVFNCGRNGGLNGTLDCATGDAYVPDPSQPAKLAVTFAGPNSPTANYWVVSTDYVSYSVVYSCFSILGLYHFEYAWILSRAPTMSQDTINKLESILANYQVPVQAFYFTPQKGCTPYKQ